MNAHSNAQLLLTWGTEESHANAFANSLVTNLQGVFTEMDVVCKYSMNIWVRRSSLGPLKTCDEWHHTQSSMSNIFSGYYWWSYGLSIFLSSLGLLTYLHTSSWQNWDECDSVYGRVCHSQSQTRSSLPMKEEIILCLTEQVYRMEGIIARVIFISDAQDHESEEWTDLIHKRALTL